MLKRFLNPRWQHPDPKVRRQAVDALSPREDAEAIASVVRDDALPAIRRLALSHVLDLTLLAERAEHDSDDTVREQALRRYRALLAGLHEGGPPLGERMELVARSSDPALMEFLVQESPDDDLRAQALVRVERESVLRDMALNDANQELRLAALARIQDEALLARVQERSRKTDKRVSHAARERLDAIREARERPKLAAAEAGRICTAMEALGHDGHWERDEGRLSPLEQRWQALDTEHRHAFEARYDAARQRVAEELASYHAAALAQRGERKAIIERLEALSGAPRDGDLDDIETWLAKREVALREARSAWKAIDTAAETGDEELTQRLHAAERVVREAIGRQRRRRELQRLLAELERLAGQKGTIAESDVKALSRAIDELPRVDGSDEATDTLERRVGEVHHKVRERLRDQASWKKDTLDGLQERLDSLKTAVTEGHTREATASYDALSTDLDALLTAGTTADRLAHARKHLAALAKDIKIMRAWGRFGARAAAERLCEQMEALTNTDESAPAVAQQVREARAAWKELARSGEGTNQALWRRFDAAATQAYLPCKAYFAERADAREANLERRRSFVRELEQFLHSTRVGAETDWKGAVRFRRDLLKRWRDAHPVARASGKALATAFDAHMAQLDKLLGRERERSLRQREQLIRDAEALAGSEDKKAAGEACKRLQSQWGVTVPGKRAQENDLWKRFRGACDAVFSERQQVFEQERASFKAGLEHRQALCQRVEALATVEANDLVEAEHELNRIRGEWSRGARLPKREGEAIETRFNDAVRRLNKRKQVLTEQNRRGALESMRARAALCHEAECSAASAESVTALQARWQALGEVPDAREGAALAARFQQALTAAAGGAMDADAAADSQAMRESICLRLEVLAGVDSPPEHNAARMALQVERLASALKSRNRVDSDTPEALLCAWCATGPAPREHAPDLEARFERAWKALDQSGTASKG